MLSKQVRFYMAMIAAVLIATIVYGFTYKNSESVSFYASLTNKEDVARQVYVAVGNEDIEIVDERLMLNEQYLKLTGGRLDMSDPQQAATADDLIWVVLTKGSSVSNLPMLSEEQKSAILGFDAATGLLIGIFSGPEAFMTPMALAFTEISDLYGTITIVAKEPTLPDTVLPTNTPITSE